MWDNLTCWQPAKIGEVVEVNCPELFSQFMSEEDYGQSLKAPHTQPLPLTTNAAGFVGLSEAPCLHVMLQGTDRVTLVQQITDSVNSAETKESNS